MEKKERKKKVSIMLFLLIEWLNMFLNYTLGALIFSYLVSECWFTP